MKLVIITVLFASFYSKWSTVFYSLLHMFTVPMCQIFSQATYYCPRTLTYFKCLSMFFKIAKGNILSSYLYLYTIVWMLLIKVQMFGVVTLKLYVYVCNISHFLCRNLSVWSFNDNSKSVIHWMVKRKTKLPTYF